MLHTFRIMIALSMTSLLIVQAAAGAGRAADTPTASPDLSNRDAEMAAKVQPIEPAAEETNYEEHKLLRINVRTQRELMTLLNAGATPWACRVGVGSQEFSVSPEQFEIVEAANMDFEVLAESVQRLFDEEREAIEAARQQAALDDNWFGVYRTTAEVNNFIDDLVDQRPDVVEKQTVGTSVEGRTIYAMRITGPGEDSDTRPAVLFNGAQHAREWISVMVPMYIADQLVNGYDSDPQITAILDNIVVYIVPIVNPDGYEYSQLDGNRLWRKNRRNNPGTTCYGVDLNRNWDIDWSGPHSTSTNPCSDVFIGAAAHSEPEVAALAAFIDARPNIAAHIDIHSYSQLVLHAWGYTTTPHPDDEIISSLGQAMSDAIYSVHGKSYPSGTPGELLYMVSGSMQDWTTDQGAFGYTIEVRPDSPFPGFQLPPEEILPTSQENFAAALTMAEFVAQGVVFSFPDELPELVDAGGGTTATAKATPVGSGPVDPDTATMYYRTDSSSDYTAVPMTWLGNEIYEVTFPATPCGAEIEFYFEIESQAGVAYRSPLGAPDNVFTAVSADIVEQILLAEDFSSGLPSGWSATGLWQATSACAVSGACEDQWMYYGETGSCSYDVGASTGILTSAPISIPDLAPGESAIMEFCYNLETENASSYDIAEVSIANGPWIRMDEASSWTTYAADVADYAGEEITIRWRFDSVDGLFNDYHGWQVTDVTVTVTSAECPDCPGDLSGDGVVDGADLLNLLSAWGPAAGNEADFNGDDVVDGADLLILLSAWGACE